MKKYLALLGVALLLLLVYFAVGQQNNFEKKLTNQEILENKVTVYKSSSCGCCSSYVEYLKAQGFNVEVVNTDNLNSLKQQYGIPSDMTSCHTTVIGNYFIEGHVPVEAIEKLLSENPDTDGISLPGMPTGSPGMSGVQAEPFKIHSIKDGRVSEFMTR